MALVIGQLVNGKPIIDVTVADVLPAPIGVERTSGSTPFQIKNYRALLDTGADVTCLCDNVVRECRLGQAGFIRMVGAVGPSLHATHIVRLGVVTGDMVAPDSGIRGIFQLDPLEAAAIRENNWFDIIVGTDVISQHELTLTRGGGFRFELF